MAKSPSLSSHLDGCGSISTAPSILSVATTATAGRHFDERLFDGRHHVTGNGNGSGQSETDSIFVRGSSLRGSRDDLLRARSSSRSRSGNVSMNWSVNEGSSCETMSIALSELTEASCLPSNGAMANYPCQMSPHGCSQQSPEHLVNRKDLLERLGMAQPPKHSRGQAGSRSMGHNGEFSPQWSMDLSSTSGNNGNASVAANNARSAFHRAHSTTSSRSVDRISISSHESQASSSEASSAAFSNYDTPKSATAAYIQNGVQGAQRKSWASQPQHGSSMHNRSCISPPMTPRSQQRYQQQQQQLQQQQHYPNYEILNSVPCLCSHGSAPTPSGDPEPPRNPYDNYDIPRSLCKQEAQQFYDTPRNMKEVINSSNGNGSSNPVNPYGNYDIPAAPIPVFKKSCGCIMKLVPTIKQKEGDCPNYTCIGSEANGRPNPPIMAASGNRPEMQIPRVKLTGTGKMPVADMRTINTAFPALDGHNGSAANQHQQQLTISDPGLPPKSPVYAVVNKANKKKTSQPTSPASPPSQQQQQQHQQQQPFLLPDTTNEQIQMSQEQQQQNGVQYHNYCNVAPLLGDVITQNDVRQDSSSNKHFHHQQLAQHQHHHQQQLQQHQFQQQQAQQQHYQQQLLQQQFQQQQLKQYDQENSVHYYENSASIMARLDANEGPKKSYNNDNNSQHGTGDYLPMEPKSFEPTPLPLIPFEPITLSIKSSGEGIQLPKYESIDPISQKLQEFQDALDSEDTSYANLLERAQHFPENGDNNKMAPSNMLFNLCDLGQALQLDGQVDLHSLGSLYCDQDNVETEMARSTSMEILTSTGWLDPALGSGENNFCSSMTPSPPPPPTPPPPSTTASTTAVPRIKKKHSESSHELSHIQPSLPLQPEQPVMMRRSASVPCKPITDRGSTSSSDSGFSAGSPTAMAAPNALATLAANESGPKN